MEINLHFVLFEELQEKPEADVAAARIVVIRSNNSDLALERGTEGLHPLE